MHEKFIQKITTVFKGRLVSAVYIVITCLAEHNKGNTQSFCFSEEIEYPMIKLQRQLR